MENADELQDALSKAQKGEVVYIKGDAIIDLTTIRKTLEIKDGVTLASDRGNGNSTGALIVSDSYASPLFRTGENVRITGLCIKGADGERRLVWHDRTIRGPLGRSYYYKMPVNYGVLTSKSGLEMDNCEIAGFSHAAIFLEFGKDHHIHHNYIHHNQRNGLGYGVEHKSSQSLIEYNLFNYNRHDIAGTGVPGSGYEARHNLQMGISLDHCFDMHGGGDRKDGTNIAGKYVLMHHNTFLTGLDPYWLRGVPEDIQDFYNNAVYSSLSAFDHGRIYGTTPEQKEKVKVRNNVFQFGFDPVVIE